MASQITSGSIVCLTAGPVKQKSIKTLLYWLFVKAIQQWLLDLLWDSPSKCPVIQEPFPYHGIMLKICQVVGGLEAFPDEQIAIVIEKF